MSLNNVSIGFFPGSWSLVFGVLFYQKLPHYVAPRRQLHTQSPKTKDPRPLHSYLNATNGSTFVARRAGMKQANNATTIKPMETVANVARSVGLTVNNKVVINRVSANAPANPTATPISAGV